MYVLSTTVALLKAIEIPAHSFYYADAYLANIEDLKIGEEKPERLLGIWSTQKVNDFFDPGFLLRDSVVPANAKSFKVELANPSAFPLKVAEDTPLGLIFDYDCEIYKVAALSLTFYRFSILELTSWQ